MFNQDGICEVCGKWAGYACDLCGKAICGSHVIMDGMDDLCEPCHKMMLDGDEKVEMPPSTRITGQRELTIEPQYIPHDHEPYVFKATKTLIVTEDVKVGRVVFSSDVWALIRALHRRFKTVEFLAGLYGKVDMASASIHAIYVPKQKVDGGSVDLDEELPSEYEGHSLLGTYHSHNEMSVFNSGTDDKYLLSQFPINVIGNNDGDVVGFWSQDVEILGSVDALIVVKTVVEIEEPSIIEQFAANIKMRRAPSIRRITYKTKGGKKNA